MSREAGTSAIELLFTAALVSTIAAMAVPWTHAGLDDVRTGSAARYLAGRIAALRMDAVRRSTALGLRFEPVSDDYVFTLFADGNGNGVRSADIRSGVDRPIGQGERLCDKFPGVRFQLPADVSDAGDDPAGSTDGVRIGTARILTVSPDGTATSGTLYVRGERAQFAVRVLGVTGRTRVLQYQSGTRTWISR
jgi:type II secretory pathway pseudopilin PulG